MTTATRKISTVLAAIAVLNFLLANRVLAASNDVEDVRTVVAGYTTAWNRHDSDAFGKLFAPDADFVNVQVFCGRAGSPYRRSMPTSTAQFRLILQDSARRIAVITESSRTAR